MNEILIPTLPPFPSLSPQCEIDLTTAVRKAQFTGGRLDFHWCEHRQTLALIGWKDNKVANWSLHSHMSPSDIARLFRDANAQMKHVPIQRPGGGDMLN